MKITYETIYINEDGTLRSKSLKPFFKGSHATVVFRLVAPLPNDHPMYVNFEVIGGYDRITRRMKLIETESVDGESWNVWQYVLRAELINSEVFSETTKLTFAFSQIYLHDDDMSQYTYKGLFNNLEDLKSEYPNPESFYYASIGTTTKISMAYKVVGGEWTETNFTLKEFESMNDYLGKKGIKTMGKLQVPVGGSVVPNSFTNDEPLTVDQYDEILAALTTLEGNQQVFADRLQERLDAYEIYLELTNDNPPLTKEQWLESLEGPQGPQGPQGAEGPQGPQGEKGEKGDSIANLDGGRPDTNYGGIEVIDAGGVINGN